MIELDTSVTLGARISVIGIGGGGGNAINNMISRGLTGVDFIAANTDRQALEHNLAPIKIQIGKETTRGLGAGANPEVGKCSVEENGDELREVLKGSDMVFVTGGMGGGTGTGGTPIIARIGQELGALVVGIVTKPFSWEGRKRLMIAEAGIKELRQYVDALIVIPNQKLLDIISIDTSFGEAFQKVDEILYNATRGISEIISCHGVVNVDFADVKTIMKGMGDALMGIGVASGENRAAEATMQALNSPLLDGIKISGAQGVLVNITGGSDLRMHEVAEAVSIVEQAAGNEVNLIHGVVNQQEPTDKIMVTVVATGFNRTEVREKEVLKSNQIKTQGQLPFTNNGSNQPKRDRFVYEKPETKVEQYDDSIINRNIKEIEKIPAWERRTTAVQQEDIQKEVNKLDNSNSNSNSNSQSNNGYNNNNNNNGSNHAKTYNLNENNINNNKFLEKPAFLRKIMD